MFTTQEMKTLAYALGLAEKNVCTPTNVEDFPAPRQVAHVQRWKDEHKAALVSIREKLERKQNEQDEQAVAGETCRHASDE